jgi:hypothetical protein
VFERAISLLKFSQASYEQRDLLAMRQRRLHPVLDDSEGIAHTIVMPDAVNVTDADALA